MFRKIHTACNYRDNNSDKPKEKGKNTSPISDMHLYQKLASPDTSFKSVKRCICHHKNIIIGILLKIKDF